MSIGAQVTWNNVPEEGIAPLKSSLSEEQKHVLSGFIRIVARDKSTRYCFGTGGFKNKKDFCFSSTVQRIEVRDLTTETFSAS